MIKYQRVGCDVPIRYTNNALTAGDEADQIFPSVPVLEGTVVEGVISSRQIVKYFPGAAEN